MTQLIDKTNVTLTHSYFLSSEDWWNGIRHMTVIGITEIVWPTKPATRA